MYSFIHSGPQLFIDFFPSVLLVATVVVVVVHCMRFFCLPACCSPLILTDIPMSLENHITQQLYPVALGSGSQKTF